MAALLSEPIRGVTSAQDRRVDVVRRLLAEGMPVRALEALLPGWKMAIAVVVAERDAGR